MFVLSVIPFTKIPFPAPQILDYFSGKKVSPGGIVRVSIGSRKILAVVLACAHVKQQKQQIKKSSFQLKQIDEIVHHESIISKPFLATVLWASEYFYAPYGLVLKSLVPPIFSKPTKKFFKELAGFETQKPNESGPPPKPILYCAQYRESSKISFYRNALQKAAKEGKSILFLVPERYKIEYFQKKIPELREGITVHSNVARGVQHETWRKVCQEKTVCVIGTRSALAFLPQNLGLIIIDEEESPFYKSFDQQPYIHAKKIVVQLAHRMGAQVILGSNFPSFESVWKARKGEYLLKKARSRKLKSEGRIVDMREELKSGNYSILSKELQTQLRDVLDKNQQAILFINRRGLSTGILCRDCGYVVKCPNCNVPMVFHTIGQQLTAISYQLICHHCGQRQKPPTLCLNCQGTRIKFIGAGTQKVERELQRFCENARLDSRLAAKRATRLARIAQTQCRIARLDTDIAPIWSLQKKVFDDFRTKKYNFLIGTQLMLKSELLPKVSLSAIITIDPLLSLPDFRMAEQILHTVDKLKGVTLSKIILQTYLVENYVIQHVVNNLFQTNKGSGDVLNKFLEIELENRKSLSFPPFSQLIKLTYGHRNLQKAEQEAQILKSKLETQAASCKLQATSFQILGPAPAFIPRVKDRYIWQIMIKSKIKDVRIRNRLLQVVPSEWKIDVDPVEMV